MIVFNCFNCQKKIEVVDRVTRKEECPHCLCDVHVCKNCDYYDESAYNECKETSADRITDKEKSNFCDYFSPSKKGNLSGGASKDDLLKAADALFKK